MKNIVIHLILATLLCSWSNQAFMSAFSIECYYDERSTESEASAQKWLEESEDDQTAKETRIWGVDHYPNRQIQLCFTPLLNFENHVQEIHAPPPQR
jgi:hypothetical protein